MYLNDKESIYKELTGLCNLLDESDDYDDGYNFQQALIDSMECYLELAPQNIKYDVKFLISLINFSGRFFSLVPDELLSNKEIILALLKSKRWKHYNNQHLFSYKRADTFFARIPEELINDKDFIIEAMNINPSIFELASDKLKEDEEIVDTALKLDISLIRYIPKDIHIDRNLMLKAVRSNGWNIEYVPNEYSEDLEILLAAIENNPYSFRNASAKFRKNVDTSILAVRDYKVPYNEIDDSMWEEQKFVLEMVKIYGTEVLDRVNFNEKPFKNNLEFTKSLLEISPNSFDSLPVKLQSNPEIIAIKNKADQSKLEQRCKKTMLEIELIQRWDNLLEDVFVNKTFKVEEFKKVFFDTFWYFRNRKDINVLDGRGFHILSSLNALVTIPKNFKPTKCKLNEFNAARCICEDLIFEINNGMKGYYTKDGFVILSRCVPPAGCSEYAAYMENFSEFEYSFRSIVEEFKQYFCDWRYESYSERYNIK